MKKLVDYKLFFSVLALIIFGMIMISSVSVYSSFRVTSIQAGAGLIDQAYNFFYVLRNMGHVFISMIVLLFVVKINYSFFEKYSKHIFGFAILLLFIVLIMGMSIKGAKGWINIPGVPFTIQPTEFLKFSLIIFLAAIFKNLNYLGKYGKYVFGGIGLLIYILILVLIINIPLILYGFSIITISITSLLYFITIYLIINYKKFLNLKNLKLSVLLSNIYLIFTGIVGLITILVGSQPDFGTIMVILPLSIIMFFYSGINYKFLGSMILMGFILVATVYNIGNYNKEIGEERNKFSYISDRIDNFLDDNKEAIKNKTINYQTEQALIAIGSGGFTGLGFGQSIQKFGYLPEVQGDFIFSVIIEELGFLGGLTVLLLYLYIGYRGLQIARGIKDPFAKYVAVGVSSRILIQAFINIGVNLNIVPLTGITMPFVSYGGSSLLSLMLAIGLLLNISRYSEKKSLYSRVDRKKIMI